MRGSNNLNKSRNNFIKARKVLPDGGSRSTIGLSPHSIYIESAKGKYLRDIDGNSYFDLNNNYTALIHGHSHPEITKVAIDQVKTGTGFSFGSKAESSFAKLLCDRNDNFQKIRFMNSGTEAVMNAIKVARAYTGRPKIIKCENSYHGSYDFAEVSLDGKNDPHSSEPISTAYSHGTPTGVLENVIVIPFNDAELASKIIEKNADQVAAILFDPFGQKYGRSIPSDIFIDTLKKACSDFNILFIADEVISFRAGYSGCQKERGIKADLTAMGKIIGGGFPIGAVAGHEKVMDMFSATNGRAKVPHGGTFNANPVSMVAGMKAMEMLKKNDFKKLNFLGKKFREGINEVFELVNIEGYAEGQFSIFGIKVFDKKLSDNTERGMTYISKGLHRYMLEHGYWLTPGLTGVCSTVMDQSDIDPFCETLLSGIKELLG